MNFLLTQATTFGTSTVIFSILGSSVTTAIITKILDFHFNRIAYKRDFYRKIIDKRIEAYESLSKSLSPTIGFSVIELQKNCYNFYFDAKVFLEVFTGIEQFASFQLWFSLQTINDILKVIIFLDNTKKKINKDTEAEFMLEIGKNDFDDLCILFKKLHKSIYKDMNRLYDVKTFLKDFNDN